MKQFILAAIAVSIVWIGYVSFTQTPSPIEESPVDEVAAPEPELADPATRMEQARVPAAVPIPTEEEESLSIEEKEQFAQIRAIQEELQMFENAPMPEPEGDADGEQPTE